MLGQPWNEATVQRVQDALSKDFTPLTDMRASAGYRLRSARNLVTRFWLETRPEGALHPEALNVWTRTDPASME